MGAFAESYQGKQAIDSLVYVMVQFARNFVVDLANYTPAPAVSLRSAFHEPRASKPLRAGRPRTAQTADCEGAGIYVLGAYRAIPLHGWLNRKAPFQ